MSCKPASKGLCPAYDEAEKLFNELTASVLDPTFQDPRFIPAAIAFERVEPGCERRSTAMSIARSIRAGQAERERAAAAPPPSYRPPPPPPYRPPPSPAPPPPPPAPAARRAEPARLVPPPNGILGQPTRIERRVSAPPPPSAPRPPPKPRAYKVLCAFFSHGGGLQTSYCSSRPLAEAQRDCDERLKRQGVDGRCDCTSSASFIGDRCR